MKHLPLVRFLLEDPVERDLLVDTVGIKTFVPDHERDQLDRVVS